MKTRSLFVAWQDPETRRRFPIGKLTFDGRTYKFAYTNGVLEADKEYGFKCLQSFPDTNRFYESEALFPVFSNRLISPSRADYQSFVEWCNLLEDI